MDRHRRLGRRLGHIGGTRSGEAINHNATSRGWPSRQHSRADHLGRRRIGYTEDASPCLRPFADLPGDDRGVDDLRARDAWWQREQRWSSDEESIQVTTEEEPSRASHRTWAPRLLRLQHRVQHRDDHLHGQLQGSCDTVPTSASVPCGSRSPRAPVSRPCVVGLPRSCSISSASSIARMLRGIPVLRPLAAVSRAVWTGVRT